MMQAAPANPHFDPSQFEALDEQCPNQSKVARVCVSKVRRAMTCPPSAAKGLPVHRMAGAPDLLRSDQDQSWPACNIAATARTKAPALLRRFNGEADAEHPLLVEMAAEDLHSDGQSSGGFTAGNADSAEPGQRGSDRVDVLEVHLHRVVGLLA